MNNPTDTNQASELYELCREVYERTGWETDYIIKVVNHGLDSQFYSLREIDGDESVDDFAYRAPNYTSDYLLEKLPRSIKRYGRFELVPTMRNTRWSAGYWTDDRLDTLSVVDYTPLKALLKLTVALSEAGELK